MGLWNKITLDRLDYENQGTPWDDRGDRYGSPPDTIRYIFYQNVISEFGVPRTTPSYKAWSTAYIDATLIV